MQNVTCFVLQLAHLPAQREDKAFRIWLKRFVFCTFQLPLARRRSPFPTQCANWRVERKKMAVKMDQKNNRCTLLTQHKKWHASYIHDIPETKWKPRSLTKMHFNTTPWWRLSDFPEWLLSLCLHKQSNGTNAKSLTQFLKWVQKQNSLLYFSHLWEPYIQ